MGKNFQVDSFIHGNFYLRSTNPKEIFGIITAVRGENISFYDLLDINENYFLDSCPDPFLSERTFNLHSEDKEIHQISQEQSLDHLNKLWSQFEEEIKSGGLSGALAVRKQYNLENLAENLKRAFQPLQSIAATFPEPNTGFYVLKGDYRPSFGHQCLEGLVTNPKRSETEIARLMTALCPQGTKNIPGKHGEERDCTSTLCGYKTYKIPRKGIHLITDPLNLKIRLYR
ncbi:MAG: hypothetical protein KKA62_00300 [Nanoarchaeota archaeon]|nr:hypothetical protein [Nanoarchaeota archaeon]MBU1644228.1 hypothetical protein [Nanoarchaeota archaeon]MBU1976377.1 hypothetical protein [Nanoarchaeota archaeon]